MNTVATKTTKKSAKKFYIGRRDNPQFDKPYYKAYGQLTKKEVKDKEDCLYGSMTLTGYDTEAEYNQKIADLKAEGFSVR